MTGSRWRSLLGGLLVLAAGLFLGLTLARHWREVQGFHWEEVRWRLLGLSTVALAAVFAWGVVVWKLVLDRFDYPAVPLSQLLRIWFISNLARYVPGKVWQFVGAAELARLAGLSRAVILTSMVVHMGFTLLAAAVVASLAFLPVAATTPAPALGTVILAALSVFLVHPTLLNRALDVAARILKRDVLRWRGSWADGLLLLALSVASWALYGGAFVLFVHGFVGVEAGSLLPLAGVNALSFLAGYLVFLAPAGLGAREGVMAVLLRPFAPAGIAALLAVLSRLWTMAAELLGAALVLLLIGNHRTPPPA